jgi:SAM-dependent methyltransferase
VVVLWRVTDLKCALGHGHNCQYLDLAKVTRYIALEPNPLMHETLVTKAMKAGFSPERIQIIGCGAEDTAAIMKALDGEQVDTIISILSLCGIPDAEGSLERMVRDILTPGGKLLFYEHVQCDLSPALTWWQTLWSPLWQAVVGCRLDKPTHLYVERLDLWEQREVWGKLPTEEPNLWWHRVGCYVKKSVA